MTEKDLDILADKIAERILFQPRWLKLRQASQYSTIGIKRLKKLAEAGEVYARQGNDRGDWIFDKESIDKYMLAPGKEHKARSEKLIDSISDWI